MALFEDQIRLKLLQDMRALQEAEWAAQAAADDFRLASVEVGPDVNIVETIDTPFSMGEDVPPAPEDFEPPQPKRRRRKEEPDADNGMA